MLHIHRERFVQLALNVREYRRSNLKNGQSRETGNIGYTRRGQTKQKTQHNMCWTPIYANKHK